VGYEEGGQLTESRRNRIQILLMKLRRLTGYLQYPSPGTGRWSAYGCLGRKVDFKNTLIIMTSNIGARQLKDFGEGVGFATATVSRMLMRTIKRLSRRLLKRTFSPNS
jgi:ATP-dependent Clp protease ATP-binding subunit ClpC